MTPKAGFTKALAAITSTVILLHPTPAKSWFGNGSEPTTECISVSAFASIPLDDNVKNLTLKVPLKASNEGDWSVLILNSPTPEFKAHTLYRTNDDWVWRGESLAPLVKITKDKNGGMILDFASSSLAESGQRRMLVVLVPGGLRGDFKVVPTVDAAHPTARTPIFYNTQSTMRGLVSHFDSLAEPVGHNIPIAPELSDQINQHSASGDILIPQAYRRKLKLANVQAITVNPCNPN